MHQSKTNKNKPLRAPATSATPLQHCPTRHQSKRRFPRPSQERAFWGPKNPASCCTPPAHHELRRNTEGFISFIRITLLSTRISLLLKISPKQHDRPKCSCDSGSSEYWNTSTVLKPLLSPRPYTLPEMRRQQRRACKTSVHNNKIEITVQRSNTFTTKRTH